MPSDSSWILQFFNNEPDNYTYNKNVTANVSCPLPKIPPIFLNKVYLTNSTNGKITDTQCDIMVEALNIQLASFCSDWSLKPVILVFSSAPPSGSYQIILTTDTQFSFPGIPSYHNTPMADGTVRAYVCVNLILPTGTTNGIFFPGTTTSYSVSHYVSYELLDMITNPSGNKNYTANTTITNIAMQAVIIAGVCDAVIPLSYIISTSSSNKVQVSDYTLPSWYNSSGTGPFNYNNTLKEPFSLSPRLTYTTSGNTSGQTTYYIKYT